MRQRLHRFLSFFVVMLVLCSAFSTAALAAGRSCSVSIPVTVQVNGDEAPAGTTYIFKIEAVTEGAPMPSDTSLYVGSAGTAAFGAIAYTAPRDYVYRIYQTTAADANLTCDPAVYTVTVRVLNSEDGGLTAQLWAVRDGADEKTEEIVFTNQYVLPESEDPQTESETETDPATQAASVLPQTGMLWWPVAVLLLAGCVLIGLYKRLNGETKDER